MNSWQKDNLTDKQKEYVALTASGRSTLDIAEESIVSQHTVRNTLTAAKERVGASSTTNLIAMAVEKGWIIRSNEEIPHEYAPDN